MVFIYGDMVKIREDMESVDLGNGFIHAETGYDYRGSRGIIRNITSDHNSGEYSYGLVLEGGGGIAWVRECNLEMISRAHIAGDRAEIIKWIETYQ